MSRREESAKGMGQRSSYAVTKDAPTKFEEEEAVQSMEQKEKFATKKPKCSYEAVPECQKAWGEIQMQS